MVNIKYSTNWAKIINENNPAYGWLYTIRCCHYPLSKHGYTTIRILITQEYK